MSQFNLKEMLDGLQKDYADDIKKTIEGGPSGSWDVDLPVDQELRATVANCTFGAAKSSGNEQFVFTFEITEPAEFAGAKFQEYVAAKPPNEAAGRKMSTLFAALGGFGPDVNPNDSEAFAANFIDRTCVVAIRKWGDEPQRNGLRWANPDNGQALRTVKPPKESKPATDLRPEINIPKDEPAAEQAPVEPPQQVPVQEEAQTPTPAQTTSLPGGVNLPPGLRG